MSSSELNLVNLPSDVIRKIGFGEETIDEIRLISPRWNLLTVEYLCNPVIKRIVWSDHTLLRIPCKLQICISRRFEHYFRVANWEIDRTVSEACSEEISRVFETKNQNNEINRLRGLFSRCERIEHLKVNGNIESINSISYALGNVIIDELEILLFIKFANSQSRNLLMELARFYSVERLIISYRDEESLDQLELLLAFLSEAASLGCVVAVKVFKPIRSPLTAAEYRSIWETKMEEWLRTAYVTATIETNRYSFSMTVHKATSNKAAI